MTYLPDFLECQQCGDEIRELSPAEAQEVAYDPYNFVVYCGPCKGDIRKEIEETVERQNY